MPGRPSRDICEHSVAVGLYYLAEDEAGRSEGFGYFGEIASLWDAVTADDLHKILVMHPTFRSVADAHEPEELFRKHHTTQPARARRPACPRAATSATMNTMVMPSDTSERLRQNVYAPSWSKRLFSDRIPGVLPDPMLTPLQRPADELVEHRDGERQLAVAGGET